MGWLVLVSALVGIADASRKVPVIVILEGDALVEFHRLHTSPLVIDHRPFRLEDAASDPAAIEQRTRLATSRAAARAQLESLGFESRAETDVVMHTLIGAIPEDSLESAARLPGVVAVHRARTFHKSLDGALPLINAFTGWLLLGGESNAGRGMKAGIIDTGVDINHPMLQDYSMTPPTGFPKGDTALTNNKVIVARSYVALNGSVSQPPTAQDRDGHGTFVAAIATGRRVFAPFATIAGVAPAAYVGNYRVFSSPEFGGSTTDAAIVAAINDAVADGMNVLNLSLGSIPIDLPSVSPLGIAVAAANKAGVLVVSSAGNDGPDPGKVSEPSNSPEAISVAATRNSRLLANRLTVNGPGNVPAALTQIAAVPSDGPAASSGTRARMWVLIGSPCSPYAASENAKNAIVLTVDSFCSFSTMAANASAAGATALVIYLLDDSDPFQISGLAFATVPVLQISAADGAALVSYSKANGNALDVSLNAVTSFPVQSDIIASFSSVGPDGETMLFKPDLSAPGTSIYSAAQINDVAGDLYSPMQFLLGDGTSFSSPMVAGAALLVRQQHPDWTPAQVKSALVSTAANVVTDNGQQAALLSSGNGRLDVPPAIQSTVALTPATLSFSSRIVPAATTYTQTFTVTNLGPSPDTFNLALHPRLEASGGTFSVSPTTTPALNPRDSATITLSFKASPLAASARGTSDGRVEITSASSSRVYTIPYWAEVVGSGIPGAFYRVRGNVQTQTVSTKLPQDLAVEVVDHGGFQGVAGAPVTFAIDSGGGSLTTTSATTDFSGFATTSWTLGPAPGTQRVKVTAAGSTNYFYASAIASPSITRAGLVNAASTTAAVAPGTIVSLFGLGLAASSGGASNVPLPQSLNGAQVLIGNIASPVFYSSPGQINFQMPFEIPLAADGTATVQMRAAVLGTPSPPVTVQLAAAAPGIFTVSQDGKGRGVVLHADNSPVTAANPAHVGETVVIFATGLGAVDPPVSSGAASPGDIPATTVAPPVVKIGGNVANVAFSGLTPGSVALYQVNAAIPSGTPAGDAALVISVGSATSNQVTVAVR